MITLFAEKTLSEAFDVVRSMRHELHDWISLKLVCLIWRQRSRFSTILLIVLDPM